MSRGGYFDLNIVVNRSQSDHLTKLQSILMAAYKYGYDTVAVNTVLDPESETSAPSGRRKNANKPFTIPRPLELREDSFVTESNQIAGRKFKILQRLTVPLSDPSHTYKLTSNEAKEYDILAVQPLTDKAFQVCVCTLDVDLISFQMSCRIPFMLRSQQVGLAFKRGIFFEICYAPTFIDSTARRNSISVGRHIVEACRGKNIVISSETQRLLDLRGPYDVINLCNLFGLKEPETARMLTANGKSLVLKSECRHSGKGVFVATPISQMPEDEKWKTMNCRNDELVLTKKRRAKMKSKGTPVKKKIREK